MAEIINQMLKEWTPGTVVSTSCLEKRGEFRGSYCNVTRKVEGWNLRFLCGSGFWNFFNARLRFDAFLDPHFGVWCQFFNPIILNEINGGWGGIRTPGTISGSMVFKTTAIVHSATHPRRIKGGIVCLLMAKSRITQRENCDFCTILLSILTACFALL